jgi:hypothetical protein
MSCPRSEEAKRACSNKGVEASGEGGKEGLCLCALRIEKVCSNNQAGNGLATKEQSS